LATNQVRFQRANLFCSELVLDISVVSLDHNIVKYVFNQDHWKVQSR